MTGLLVKVFLSSCASVRCAEIEPFFLHWLHCWRAEHSAPDGTCKRIFTELTTGGRSTAGELSWSCKWRGGYLLEVFEYARPHRHAREEQLGSVLQRATFPGGLALPQIPEVRHPRAGVRGSCYRVPIGLHAVGGHFYVAATFFEAAWGLFFRVRWPSPKPASSSPCSCCARRNCRRGRSGRLN